MAKEKNSEKAAAKKKAAAPVEVEQVKKTTEDEVAEKPHPIYESLIFCYGENKK